jgi:eukaryotic-like serine/threonine-protein kinase
MLRGGKGFSMPVPVSTDEFLDLVRKSGVADDAKLTAYMEKLSEAKIEIPDQPSKLAGRLVRDGMLTFFQAEQILQGKYKRFTIGKYKVLEKLGVGGMGQVFLCEHAKMKRRVAVKVLPIAKSEDEAATERFYREARAAAALDHPNIVRAFDVDQDDNLHYLVMEFVDGSNFHDIVKKHGPLDVTRACHYIYGAAAGLQYANTMGIVHRDIKPGNLLLDRGGVVKVLDMGLARFFRDEEDHITRKYDENVLGTADYLSPEQALDSHTVDIRSDLYSLGGTFYYMLTGTAPFPDGNVAQKLLAHQVKEPKPIREHRHDVPDEVAAIISKMMAKKVEDRYQTPAELMTALTHYVQVPIAPPPEKEMPQFSRAAGGATSSLAAAARSAAGVGVPSAVAMSSSGAPIIAFPSSTTLSASSISNLMTASALGAGIWEDIASDTALSANTADTPVEARRTTSKAPSSRRVPASVSPDAEADAEPTTRFKSKRKLIIGVAVAGILAIGGILAAILSGGPTNTPDGGSGPKTLTVSKSALGPSDTAFTTITAALKKVNPGDRIVLTDDVHEEPLTRVVSSSAGKLKGVVIEAGNASSNVRIKLPDAAFQGKDRGLFELSGVDGLTIRNLTLDLADRVDYGITISGPCDGLTLEGITILRPHYAGINIDKAFGTVERPIRIDRCHVSTANANCDGMQLRGQTRLPANHISITNCRFHGPGWNAIHMIGLCENVLIRNNRIYHFDYGVKIDKALNQDLYYGMSIVNNTFHTISTAMIGLSELPAADRRNELVFEFNLTIKSKNYVQTIQNKIPGLRTAGNGKDRETKAAPNAIDMKTTDVVVSLPVPTAADPANYLKIAETDLILTVDGKKVKIGARE